MEFKNFFAMMKNRISDGADMGIGEEYESGLADAYYDPNNKIVKDQAKANGEY